MIKLVGETYDERTKTLDLSRKGLTGIPDLSGFKKLEDLSLRFNRIEKIERLDDLPFLHKLDLCGNRIQKIEGLESVPRLTRLNLSGNNISRIENLNQLTNLRRLYLADNLINKIENLEGLPLLEVLDLSNTDIELAELTYIGYEGNRNGIRVIENIDLLKNLKELKLARNKITQVPNLEGLSLLEKIDISGNSDV